MDCEAYLLLLSGHLDRMNSAEEEAALQAHLNTCESCRARLEEMKRNDALLSLTPEPPADLTQRIMAQVRTSQTSSGRKRRFLRWTASAGAAAAVLALVFIGGKILNPGTDAALFFDETVEIRTSDYGHPMDEEGTLYVPETAPVYFDETEELGGEFTDSQTVDFSDGEPNDNSFSYRSPVQGMTFPQPFALVMDATAEDLELPPELEPLDFLDPDRFSEEERMEYTELMDALISEFPQLSPESSDAWEVQVFKINYGILDQLLELYGDQFELIFYAPPSEDSLTPCYLFLVREKNA